MNQSVEGVQGLEQRIALLERAVTSLPPPAAAETEPPQRTRRGLWAWFDEKLLITAIISLIGIWATRYTNDRQLEIETVKYQLEQYVAAEDPDDRLAVLTLIKGMPHTSEEMRRWAVQLLDETRALREQEAAKAKINETIDAKVERGEPALLTQAEQRAVTDEAKRKVQEDTEQLEQGVKSRSTPLANERARARALWVQGYKEYGNGNFQKAQELFLRSVAIDDRYAPPVNSLGNIALVGNKPELAAQKFRQALSLDPTYAPASYNLVLALAAQQQTDAARTQLDEARRLKPDYAKRVEVEKAVGTSPH